jgi:5-methylcytosine-specific restriction endonuclease McrA
MIDLQKKSNDDQKNFSVEQKKFIFERDNFKCSMCGLSKSDGAKLFVSFIKPRDKGGKATLENGQVLCSQHNFLKKNLNQTESGKKMFINLYNLAKSAGDKKLIDFTKQILKTYEKFDINGHIDWDE